MLRASRASYALIRSLLLGTAAITTTALVSPVLVGCKDENQPEYWLDKIDDPKWRPRAVKRLTQFLDDALGRANNDMSDPAVKELENTLVVPLTKAYVENYGELDTQTRVELIKLLADFRDERAVPALTKAFEEFAKRPRTTKDEADIKWAVRAYGDMKKPEMAAAVLAAFEKLEAHTQLGGITYKDYSKAMVDGASPTWASSLIGMLSGEIKHPTSGKTKEQQRDLIDPYRDQLFWQVTAAQVLGEIGGQDAVEPLLKVLLDPSKGEIATTALLALVKIGKPAVARAIKMLDESDPLVDFHKKKVKEATDAKELPKGNPALPIAAAVIGMAGRAEGIDPLIAAMNKAGIEEADKAVIAQELTKIPATEKSKQAFKTAFESISLETTLPNRTPALIALAEAAGDFYDPSMVDWLLSRAEATSGGGEEKKALQQTLATTALKVAKVGQLAAIKAAAKRYGVDDLLKYGAPLLEKCGDKVDCYLTEVEKTENQSKDHQMAGIKAAYMVGILGNEQSRDALIERLPSLENAAVHFVATKSIDKLTPTGDEAVVTQLEELIEKNEKSADADKLSANAPLKQIAYRISARAN